MTSTFAAALERRVKHSPGDPLVTFYDHATGERVELSAVTYANWVAKAAGLLSDEHDLERGMRIRLDLPAHWLGTVFLGAAWTVGLVVTDGDDVDVVVCGPDTVDQWAERADELPVLACSLLPLGVRFRDPLPGGVHDVGIEVWSQPDAFTAWDAPTGDDTAYAWGGEQGTLTDMVEAAATGSLLTDGGRLLTVANPTSPSGVATFIEPLVRGGSMVLVANADPERLEVTAEQERVTARA
ncbi:TIGR03089 family protein [Nocardioides daphniae]|uniref:Acyl-CoA synthetase n=1 Tax=Nocardioides daphniae TaxID=402297 RepID=A0A4P7UCC3_9ACTN|nr:TIGR03089 family protein [Nocardioides daphniae]QCC77852.1 TIGR03089 family protein [Nocardioides daphniae]GGD27723.1 acyl-CoA synthetase [Nocardioides daphniae]